MKVKHPQGFPPAAEPPVRKREDKSARADAAASGLLSDLTDLNTNIRDQFTQLAKDVTQRITRPFLARAGVGVQLGLIGAAVLGKKIKEVAEPLVGQARHFYLAGRVQQLKVDAAKLPSVFSRELKMLEPDLAHYDASLNLDALAKDIDRAEFLIAEYRELGTLPNIETLSNDAPERYQTAWANAIENADHRAQQIIFRNHRLIAQRADLNDALTESRLTPTQRQFVAKTDYMLGDLNTPLADKPEHETAIASLSATVGAVRLHTLTFDGRLHGHRVADLFADQMRRYTEDMLSKPEQLWTGAAPEHARDMAALQQALAAAATTAAAPLTLATKDRLLEALSWMGDHDTRRELFDASRDPSATHLSALPRKTSVALQYASDILQRYSADNTRWQSLVPWAGVKDPRRLEYTHSGWGDVGLDVMNDNAITRAYREMMQSENPAEQRQAELAKDATHKFIDRLNGVARTPQAIQLTNDADWATLEKTILHDSTTLDGLDAVLSRAETIAERNKPPDPTLKRIEFLAAANRLLGAEGRSPGHTSDSQAARGHYAIADNMLAYMQRHYPFGISHATAQQRLAMVVNEDADIDARRHAATVYEYYLYQEEQKGRTRLWGELQGSADLGIRAAADGAIRDAQNEKFYDSSAYETIPQIVRRQSQFNHKYQPLAALKTLREYEDQIAASKELIQEYTLTGKKKTAEEKFIYQLNAGMAVRIARLIQDFDPLDLDKKLAEIREARKDIHAGDMNHFSAITHTIEGAQTLALAQGLTEEALKVNVARDLVREGITFAAATIATAGVGTALELATQSARLGVATEGLVAGAQTVSRFKRAEQIASQVANAWNKAVIRQGTFLHTKAAAELAISGHQSLYDPNASIQDNLFNLGVSIVEFELMGKFHKVFKDVWKVAPAVERAGILRQLISGTRAKAHELVRDVVFFHGWLPAAGLIKTVAHGDTEHLAKSVDDFGSQEGLAHTAMMTLSMGTGLGTPLSQKLSRAVLRSRVPEIRRVANHQKQIEKLEHKLATVKGRSLKALDRIAELRYQQLELAQQNAHLIDAAAARHPESEALREQAKQMHLVVNQYFHANRHAEHLWSLTQMQQEETQLTHDYTAQKDLHTKKIILGDLRDIAERRTTLARTMFAEGMLDAYTLTEIEKQKHRVTLEERILANTEGIDAAVATLESITPDTAVDQIADHIATLLARYSVQKELIHQSQKLIPNRFPPEAMRKVSSAIAILTHSLEAKSGIREVTQHYRQLIEETQRGADYADTISISLDQEASLLSKASKRKPAAGAVFLTEAEGLMRKRHHAMAQYATHFGIPPEALADLQRQAKLEEKMIQAAKTDRSLIPQVSLLLHMTHARFHAMRIFLNNPDPALHDRLGVALERSESELRDFIDRVAHTHPALHALVPLLADHKTPLSTSLRPRGIMWQTVMLMPLTLGLGTVGAAAGMRVPAPTRRTQPIEGALFEIGIPGLDKLPLIAQGASTEQRITIGEAQFNTVDKWLRTHYLSKAEPEQYDLSTEIGITYRTWVGRVENRVRDALAQYESGQMSADDMKALQRSVENEEGCFQLVFDTVDRNAEMSRSDPRKWFSGNLKSAVTQSLQTWLGVLGMVSGDIRAKIPPKHSEYRDFIALHTLRGTESGYPEGMMVHESVHEIARELMWWLNDRGTLHARGTELTWEAPATEHIAEGARKTQFDQMAWPPNLANNHYLRSMLKFLGWSMEVAQHGDRVMVTLRTTPKTELPPESRALFGSPLHIGIPGIRDIPMPAQLGDEISEKVLHDQKTAIADWLHIHVAEQGQPARLAAIADVTRQHESWIRRSDAELRIILSDLADNHIDLDAATQRCRRIVAEGNVFILIHDALNNTLIPTERSFATLQRSSLSQMHNAISGAAELIPMGIGTTKGDSTLYDILDTIRTPQGNDYGIAIPRPLYESARNLLWWLDNYGDRSSGQLTWVRHDGAGEKRPHKILFNAYLTPPSPETDAILATHLQILGWKMRVEDHGQRVTLEIPTSQHIQSEKTPPFTLEAVNALPELLRNAIRRHRFENIADDAELSQAILHDPVTAGDGILGQLVSSMIWGALLDVPNSMVNPRMTAMITQGANSLHGLLSALEKLPTEVRPEGQQKNRDATAAYLLALHHDSHAQQFLRNVLKVVDHEHHTDFLSQLDKALSANPQSAPEVKEEIGFGLFGGPLMPVHLIEKFGQLMERAIQTGRDLLAARAATFQARAEETADAIQKLPEGEPLPAALQRTKSQLEAEAAAIETELARAAPEPVPVEPAPSAAEPTRPIKAAEAGAASEIMKATRDVRIKQPAADTPSAGNGDMKATRDLRRPQPDGVTTPRSGKTYVPMNAWRNNSDLAAIIPPEHMHIIEGGKFRPDFDMESRPNSYLISDGIAHFSGYVKLGQSAEGAAVALLRALEALARHPNIPRPHRRRADAGLETAMESHLREAYQNHGQVVEDAFRYMQTHAREIAEFGEMPQAEIEAAAKKYLRILGLNPEPPAPVVVTEPAPPKRPTAAAPEVIAQAIQDNLALLRNIESTSGGRTTPRSALFRSRMGTMGSLGATMQLTHDVLIDAASGRILNEHPSQLDTLRRDGREVERVVLRLFNVIASTPLTAIRQRLVAEGAHRRTSIPAWLQDEIRNAPIDSDLAYAYAQALEESKRLGTPLKLHDIFSSRVRHAELGHSHNIPKEVDRALYQLRGAAFGKSALPAPEPETGGPKGGGTGGPGETGSRHLRETLPERPQPPPPYRSQHFNTTGLFDKPQRTVVKQLTFELRRLIFGVSRQFSQSLPTPDVEQGIETNMQGLALLLQHVALTQNLPLPNNGAPLKTPLEAYWRVLYDSMRNKPMLERIAQHLDDNAVRWGFLPTRHLDILKQFKSEDAANHSWTGDPILMALVRGHRKLHYAQSDNAAITKDIDAQPAMAVRAIQQSLELDLLHAWDRMSFGKTPDEVFSQLAVVLRRLERHPDLPRPEGRPALESALQSYLLSTYLAHPEAQLTIEENLRMADTIAEELFDTPSPVRFVDIVSPHRSPNAAHLKEKSLFTAPVEPDALDPNQATGAFSGVYDVKRQGFTAARPTSTVIETPRRTESAIYAALPEDIQEAAEFNASVLEGNSPLPPTHYSYRAIHGFNSSLGSHDAPNAAYNNIPGYIDARNGQILALTHTQPKDLADRTEVIPITVRTFNPSRHPELTEMLRDVIEGTVSLDAPVPDHILRFVQSQPPGSLFHQALAHATAESGGAPTLRHFLHQRVIGIDASGSPAEVLRALSELVGTSVIAVRPKDRAATQLPGLPPPLPDQPTSALDHVGPDGKVSKFGGAPFVDDFIRLMITQVAGAKVTDPDFKSQKAGQLTEEVLANADTYAIVYAETFSNKRIERALMALNKFIQLVRSGHLDDNAIHEGAQGMARALINGFAGDQSPIAPHSLLFYANRLLGLSERNPARDRHDQTRIWEEEAFRGFKQFLPEPAASPTSDTVRDLDSLVSTPKDVADMIQLGRHNPGAWVALAKVSAGLFTRETAQAVVAACREGYPAEAVIGHLTVNANDLLSSISYVDAARLSPQQLAQHLAEQRRLIQTGSSWEANVAMATADTLVEAAKWTPELITQEVHALLELVPTLPGGRVRRIQTIFESVLMHHQLSTDFLNRIVNADSFTPQSQRGTILEGKERDRFLDNLKWYDANEIICISNTLLAAAHDAAKNGRPIPPTVLINTGGREDQYRDLLDGSRQATPLPLELIPAQRYHDVMLQNQRQFNLRRGGKNLSIEFYVSLPDILEFIRQNPESVAKDAAFISILPAHLPTFMQFVRDRNVTTRIIAPTENHHITIPAMSRHPNTHVQFLSERDLKLDEDTQAATWAREVAQPQPSTVKTLPAFQTQPDLQPKTAAAGLQEPAVQESAPTPIAATDVTTAQFADILAKHFHEGQKLDVDLQQAQDDIVHHLLTEEAKIDKNFAKDTTSHFIVRTRLRTDVYLRLLDIRIQSELRTRGDNNVQAVVNPIVSEILNAAFAGPRITTLKGHIDITDRDGILVLRPESIDDFAAIRAVTANKLEERQNLPFGFFNPISTLGIPVIVISPDCSDEAWGILRHELQHFHKFASNRHERGALPPLPNNLVQDGKINPAAQTRFMNGMRDYLFKLAKDETLAHLANARPPQGVVTDLTKPGGLYDYIDLVKTELAERIESHVGDTMVSGKHSGPITVRDYALSRIDTMRARHDQGITQNIWLLYDAVETLVDHGYHPEAARQTLIQALTPVPYTNWSKQLPKIIAQIKTRPASKVPPESLDPQDHHFRLRRWIESSPTIREVHDHLRHSNESQQLREVLNIMLGELESRREVVRRRGNNLSEVVQLTAKIDHIKALSNPQLSTLPGLPPPLENAPVVNYSGAPWMGELARQMLQGVRNLFTSRAPDKKIDTKLISEELFNILVKKNQTAFLPISHPFDVMNHFRIPSKAMFGRRDYTQAPDHAGYQQVNDESRRIDALNAQVLAIGARKHITAHGMGEDNITNFAEVIIGGALTTGYAGPLADGPPEFMSGPHGPLYIIIDPKRGKYNPDSSHTVNMIHHPRDSHLGYLVPTAEIRAAYCEAIDHAVGKGVMSAEDAATAKSKLITYEEFIAHDGELEVPARIVEVGGRHHLVILPGRTDTQTTEIDGMPEVEFRWHRGHMEIRDMRTPKPASRLSLRRPRAASRIATNDIPLLINGQPPRAQAWYQLKYGDTVQLGHRVCEVSKSAGTPSPQETPRTQQPNAVDPQATARRLMDPSQIPDDVAADPRAQQIWKKTLQQISDNGIAQVLGENKYFSETTALADADGFITSDGSIGGGITYSNTRDYQIACKAVLNWGRAILEQRGVIVLPTKLNWLAQPPGPLVHYTTYQEFEARVDQELGKKMPAPLAPQPAAAPEPTPQRAELPIWHTVSHDTKVHLQPYVDAILETNPQRRRDTERDLTLAANELKEFEEGRPPTLHDVKQWIVAARKRHSSSGYHTYHNPHERDPSRAATVIMDLEGANQIWIKDFTDGVRKLIPEGLIPEIPEAATPERYFIPGSEHWWFGGDWLNIEGDTPIPRYEGRIFFGVDYSQDEHRDVSKAALLYAKLHELALAMKKEGSSIQFKITAKRQGRNDAGVLYFHAKDQERIYKAMLEISRLQVTADRLPLFVAPLTNEQGDALPGIGFAQHPKASGVSFGSRRTQAIAHSRHVLEDEAARGVQRPREEIEGILAAALDAAGIDPDIPAFDKGGRNLFPFLYRHMRFSREGDAPTEVLRTTDLPDLPPPLPKHRGMVQEEMRIPGVDAAVSAAQMLLNGAKKLWATQFPSKPYSTQKFAIALSPVGRATTLSLPFAKSADAADMDAARAARRPILQKWVKSNLFAHDPEAASTALDQVLIAIAELGNTFNQKLLPPKEASLTSGQYPPEVDVAARATLYHQWKEQSGVFRELAAIVSELAKNENHKMIASLISNEFEIDLWSEIDAKFEVERHKFGIIWQAAQDVTDPNFTSAKNYRALAAMSREEAEEFALGLRHDFASDSTIDAMSGVLVFIQLVQLNKLGRAAILAGAHDIANALVNGKITPDTAEHPLYNAKRMLGLSDPLVPLTPDELVTHWTREASQHLVRIATTPEVQAPSVSPDGEVGFGGGGVFMIAAMAPHLAKAIQTWWARGMHELSIQLAMRMNARILSGQHIAQDEPHVHMGTTPVTNVQFNAQSPAQYRLPLQLDPQTGEIRALLSSRNDVPTNPSDIVVSFQVLIPYYYGPMQKLHSKALAMHLAPDTPLPSSLKKEIQKIVETPSTPKIFHDWWSMIRSKKKITLDDVFQHRIVAFDSSQVPKHLQKHLQNLIGKPYVPPESRKTAQPQTHALSAAGGATLLAQVGDGELASFISQHAATLGLGLVGLSAVMWGASILLRPTKPTSGVHQKKGATPPARTLARSPSPQAPSQVDPDAEYRRIRREINERSTPAPYRDDRGQSHKAIDVLEALVDFRNEPTQAHFDKIPRIPGLTDGFLDAHPQFQRSSPLGFGKSHPRVYIDLKDIGPDQRVYADLEDNPPCEILDLAKVNAALKSTPVAKPRGVTRTTPPPRHAAADEPEPTFTIALQEQGLDPQKVKKWAVEKERSRIKRTTAIYAGAATVAASAVIAIVATLFARDDDDEDADASPLALSERTVSGIHKKITDLTTKLKEVSPTAVADEDYGSDIEVRGRAMADARVYSKFIVLREKAIRKGERITVNDLETLLNKEGVTDLRARLQFYKLASGYFEHMAATQKRLAKIINIEDTLPTKISDADKIAKFIGEEFGFVPKGKVELMVRDVHIMTVFHDPADYAAASAPHDPLWRKDPKEYTNEERARLAGILQFAERTAGMSFGRGVTIQKHYGFNENAEILKHEEGHEMDALGPYFAPPINPWADAQLAPRLREVSSDPATELKTADQLLDILFGTNAQYSFHTEFIQYLREGGRLSQGNPLVKGGLYDPMIRGNYENVIKARYASHPQLRDEVLKRLQAKHDEFYQQADQIYATLKQLDEQFENDPGFEAEHKAKILSYLAIRGTRDWDLDFLQSFKP